MPIRYALGVLTALLCVVISPAHAGAQAAPTAAETEEQARAHFRLGRAHYDNGNFAQAAVEFEAAYRISQRAALLYNIYLAYRDANDTRNAAEALRKYLLLEKDIENRGQLESRLAALDRSLEEEPPPGAVAAPGPAQPQTPAPAAPAPEAAVAPAPAAPLAKPDAAAKPFPIVPVVLMGTGGAMIATSVVTGLMVSSKQGEYDDARTACEKAENCGSLTRARVQELHDLKGSGETLALITDILLFGGVAVAGTGVVLFLLDQGSEERPPSATASIACLPGRCGATLRGAF